jgi:hypothetical protein
MPAGVTGSAETPEHLSRQSPNFSQPPLVCLSQCWASGQQSDAAAADISGETATAPAEAIGSMDTERAVKATIRARAMRMVC